MGMTITEIKPEQIFLGENQFMTMRVDFEFPETKTGSLLYYDTDPISEGISLSIVDTFANISVSSILYVYGGESVTVAENLKVPVCVGGKVDFSKLLINTGDINALTDAQKMLIKAKLTQSGIQAIDVNDQTVYDNQ